MSLTCSLVLVMATLLASSHAINMKSSVFSTFVERNCYKKTTQGVASMLGQSGPEGPLGQSMENFISLVEKIELQKENSNRPPNVLAGIILSRWVILFLVLVFKIRLSSSS